MKISVRDTYYCQKYKIEGVKDCRIQIDLKNYNWLLTEICINYNKKTSKAKRYTEGKHDKSKKMDDLKHTVTKNKNLGKKKPLILPVSIPIQRLSNISGSQSASKSDLKRVRNKTMPDLNPIKLKKGKEQDAVKSAQIDKQDRSVASFKVRLNTLDNTATIINDPGLSASKEYSKLNQTFTTPPSSMVVNDQQTQIPEANTEGSMEEKYNNVKSLRNIRNVSESKSNLKLSSSSFTQNYAVAPCSSAKELNGAVGIPVSLQKLPMPKIPVISFSSKAVQTVQPMPESKIPVTVFSRAVQTDSPSFFVTREEYDIVQFLNSNRVNSQQLIDYFEYIASENNNNINQPNIEVREEVTLTKTVTDQPIAHEIKQPATANVEMEDEDTLFIDEDAINRIVAFSDQNKKILRQRMIETNKKVIDSFCKDLSNDKTLENKKINPPSYNANNNMNVMKKESQTQSLTIEHKKPAAPKEIRQYGYYQNNATHDPNTGTDANWRQSRRLHQYQDITYPNGMPSERGQDTNYGVRPAGNEMPNAMYLARRHTMPVQVPTSRQRPPISSYEQFYNHNYRNPQIAYSRNTQEQYPHTQPGSYSYTQNGQYQNMSNGSNMMQQWSWNMHPRGWS